MLRTATILLFFLLLVPSDLVAQQVVELQAVKDNTLYEDVNGNLSNGSGQHLFAGMTNRDEIRRALVAFDVSGALPDGAVVDSVQLQLTMNKSLGTTHHVHLHRVTQDWGEAGSDPGGQEGGGTTPAAGDATWLHTFLSTSTWTQPGGDFVALESASIPVSATGAAVWYNTTDLTADVNHWLSTPAANFGWLVMGDELATASAQRFSSRENADPSARPLLRIFYSVTPTFVEEQVFPASFRLKGAWPNPFSSLTTVSVESDQAGSIHLQVIDMQGRVVHQSIKWTPAGSHDLDVDGSDWAPGVYLVRISGAGGLITRPMVRMR